MFLILISAQAEPILCGNNPLLGKLRPFIVECFQLRRECCFFLREARHFSDIREDFLPGHLLVDLIAARFQTGDLSLQFFQPVFFFPGFGLKLLLALPVFCAVSSMMRVETRLIK